jgi:hypothetical protein
LFDRILRMIVAVIIAILYFTKVLTGAPGIILLILAGIFLLTGIIGFCPLYIPFRINTAKNKKNK